MKPVVGITAGHRTDENATTPFNRIDISAFYSRAVVAAGGIPFILPSIPGTEAEVLEHVDALVFSGGSDLDPALFGEDTVHPDTYGIDPNRDAFELTLARLAYDRDLPTFGICRGIQSLNVALGGTLYQHVPEFTSTPHNQSKINIVSHEPSHTVSLAEGSAVSELFGGTVVEANSFHHQSLKKVAAPFKATAWTADGVVEAVEAPERTCFFAVQWHPEMMFAQHEEQLAPFRRLLEIAEARKLAGVNG
jgi:putative glutamine amidotransferase